MSTFEELVAEGESVPVEGWDFSWFDGRATEERPPWGYARLVADRMARSAAALDLQTGGGEVTASLATLPPLLVATEAWLPNVPVAGRNLGARGGWVVAADGLPFRDASFDLVTSRHPVSTPYDEIARVLHPGGTFLSQQIGAGTVRELSEAMLGPLPPVDPLFMEAAAAAARAAGFDVTDLRKASLRMTFDDVGALVHFLRKVVWIVPGFTVERFHTELRRLHERIQVDGPFVAHSQRFLIEARLNRA